MCDVTISPKSWENCYATVQDYRRRFADPYYFEFGSGTQTIALHWLLIPSWQTEKDATLKMRGLYIRPRLRPPREKHVSRFFQKFNQRETIILVENLYTPTSSQQSIKFLVAQPLYAQPLPLPHHAIHHFSENPVWWTFIFLLALSSATIYIF